MGSYIAPPATLGDVAGNTKGAQGSKKPRGKPFEPGQSGNPGGRERIPQDVKEMLRAATPRAAKVLIQALDAEKAVVVGQGQFKPAEIEYVPDYDLRIKAAGAIFDRLYGKPAMAITDENGGTARLGLIFLPAESDE